ncbi:MAG: 2-oxoglutarate dehydrogenase E1 subunit family protein, partial [Gammaproteobacteria bacterium]
YLQRYQSTPLSGGNADYVEALYEQYLADSAAVSAEWAGYFRALAAGAVDTPRLSIERQLAASAHAHRLALGPGNGALHPEAAEKQAAVIRLIEAYRGRGHLRARLDPLGLNPVPEVPDLELAYHGLSEADMPTVFSSVSLTGPDRMPLADIWSMLRETYLGTIGFEFMHMTNGEERVWLRRRLEAARAKLELTRDERLNIFNSLVCAEGMEKYLHTRYVGQKRFSIEGGESMIAMLHDLVNQASREGVQETVIGMAHRGRLNVQINVLGKSPRELFEEFAGTYDPKVDVGSGDVKYHLGFSSDVRAAGGIMHVALAFNPSHLEIVDPVVAGSVRA